MAIATGDGPDQASYVVSTPAGRVRLLLNDTSDPWVFSNGEILAFLDLEGQNLKRAAAQAIDTNASNEALASKVLHTQDVDTDGAKLADALRKHAADLRAQADREEERSEDFAFFDLVHLASGVQPELTEWPPFL